MDTLYRVSRDNSRSSMRSGYRGSHHFPPSSGHKKCTAHVNGKGHIGAIARRYTFVVHKQFKVSQGIFGTKALIPHFVSSDHHGP